MRQDKASYFLDYNLVNSFRNLLIMETKEFKTMFGKIAKSNGFKLLYGGWYKESNDCIIALELQRSNYSILYYLNIKIYIRGAFGEAYTVNKYIIKNDTGHIFRRQPKEYDATFDLETNLDENTRKAMLEKLFETYVVPLTDKALSLEGIKELINKGLWVDSAVKEELDKKLQEKAAKAKNAEEQ